VNVTFAGVMPALCNVGIELLYMLYVLTYANPLGLLGHVGKVILFLLSCIVQKHSEKVKIMQLLNDSQKVPLSLS
jgi:hypothetical protein